MRRNSEAAKRAQERRERENDAARLLDVVPELQSLQLEIQETRDGLASADVKHKRFIMVDRAPALFDIPCSDRGCDGEYDFTGAIMRNLRSHATHFEGHGQCAGRVKDRDCAFEMRFVATAAYG